MKGIHINFWSNTSQPDYVKQKKFMRSQNIFVKITFDMRYDTNKHILKKIILLIKLEEQIFGGKGSRS